MIEHFKCLDEDPEARWAERRDPKLLIVENFKPRPSEVQFAKASLLVYVTEDLPLARSLFQDYIQQQLAGSSIEVWKSGKHEFIARLDGLLFGG